MPYDTNIVPDRADFHSLLDEINTYLWMGEAWHEKAANENRKMAVRGVARWHEAEGCYDAKERVCLNKLLRDKLHYAPKTDMSMLDRAMQYIIANSNDFKSQFAMWAEREKKFIECLNAAITQAGSVDMELYKKLCGLVSEVQNEAMRVEMVYARLDLAGWQGHDIGVCSMILHKYFECEYDGGMIDFNLG